MDLEAALVLHALHKIIYIVTVEKSDPTTLAANQQMLVTMAGSDVSLAFVWLVDALYKMQIF